MPEPLRWLFKVFDILVVVGMAVISLLIFTNVVLRYGFSSGIPFAVEVSRVILVWVIFLGAVVGLAKGAHLSVDALVARLPQKARFACFLVSYSLMLWCCWLLGRGSWALTRIEWGNITPLTGLPVGLTYAAGLVAAIMMALILLLELWRSLRGTLPRTWAGAKSDQPPLTVSPASSQERIQ
ncbi:TRAP transporter small permease [Mesorhizobium microcysteis]|uniref:TRAP transporter small permease protein n=1 Tax=Neoaquamicrobium microcysteis TaxID=2682781 RepID=A0A5D4H7N1_9HYPH|nr:TRAP transporter small permease [Mesorhizobium microcysteis]TYR35455.1 TRAP transporter small permease [Mesorhizobium microcysteis]